MRGHLRFAHRSRPVSVLICYRALSRPCRHGQSSQGRDKSVPTGDILPSLPFLVVKVHQISILIC